MLFRSDDYVVEIINDKYGFIIYHAATWYNDGPNRFEDDKVLGVHLDAIASDHSFKSLCYRFISCYANLTGHVLGVKEGANPHLISLTKLRALFIHKKAWDGFASELIDDCGNNSKWYGDVSFVRRAQTLESLGFIHEENLSRELRGTVSEYREKHRYCEVFRLPGESKYELRADEMSAHIFKQGSNSYWGDVSASTYTIQDLVLNWNKISKVQLAIPEKELKLSRNDVHFEALQRDVKADEEEPLKYRDGLRFFSNRNPLVGCADGLEKWQYLRDVFADSIKDGSLKKELLELHNVQCNLSSCGKRLEPSKYFCPQDGNFFATKRLGELTQALSDKFILEDEDNKGP